MPNLEIDRMIPLVILLQMCGALNVGHEVAYSKQACQPARPSIKIQSSVASPVLKTQKTYIKIQSSEVSNRWWFVAGDRPASEDVIVIEEQKPSIEIHP
jgi:hypothetical protein